MTWRQRAKDHINHLDSQMPTGIALEERKAVLRDNYPFGAREMHPYKAWLKEQKIYLAKHGLKPRNKKSNKAKLEALWEGKLL